MSRAALLAVTLILALLLATAAACQLLFPTVEAGPDAGGGDASGDVVGLVDGNGGETGGGDAGGGDGSDGSVASKDFAISVNPGYLPLAGGDSKSVTVTVQRFGNFNGAVTVSLTPPVHVTGTTMTTVPPNVTTGSLVLTADVTLPPSALGDFSVKVLGADAALMDFAMAPLIVHLSGHLATFTSGTTQFNVPSSVSLIEMKAWGAGGGSGCNSGGVNGGGPGGSGGFVSGLVTVAPNETLTVAVGATSAGSCTGVSGGGSGSAVLRKSTRLIIAGGGGGGGWGCSAIGGPGGGGGGAKGGDAPMGACDALGGGGGTQNADGVSQPNGSAGSGGSGLHDGGNGGSDNQHTCGCPGSGGGGGASGGSDLVDAGVMIVANLTAQGPPPNTADPDYLPDAGAGAGPNIGGNDNQGKLGNDGHIVFLVP